MHTAALLLALLQTPLSLGPLGGDAQAVLALPGPSQTLLVARSSGLLRSTDGGQSFVPFGVGLPSSGIVDLELDPTQSQRLLALVGNQVYVSLDDGALWTPSPAFPGSAGRDLAVSPADGSWLVSNGNNLWRAPGEAGPWTQVASGSILDPVAFAPNDPQRVYAGGINGLLRSTNGGASFSPIGSSQWVQAIGVSPINADVLLLGLSSGLRRSTDGGVSSQPITQGLPSNPNAEWLVWHPNGLAVWFGHLTGVAYSSDAGLTFQANNQGFGAQPPIPTDLALGQNGGLFLTGEASAGGFYASAGALQTWNHLGFADGPIRDVLFGQTASTARVGGTFNGVFVGLAGGKLDPSGYQADFGTSTQVLAADPLNPDRILAGGVGAFLDDAKIAVLTNGAQSAAIALSQFGAGTVEELVFQPGTPNVVLAGVFPGGFGNSAIWRSTDGGASFQPVLGTAGWATRAISFDPLLPNRVLQLSDNGQWASSNNGGQTWSNLAPAWPVSGPSATLAHDLGVAQRLWRADTGSGWWVSDNGGGNWTNLGLSAGLDAEIAFVPGQPLAAIVGTANGQVRYLPAPNQPSIPLYQSSTAGAITGLALEPSSGALLFGTEQAGAVEVPLALPFLPLTGGSTSSLGSTPALFGSGLPSVSGGLLALGCSRLPAAAPGLLGVSTGLSPLPLFGGTLLPALPFFITAPVVADGAGTATPSFPLPNNSNLVGLHLFLQAGFLDGAAPDPSGIILTNALRVKLFD
jgi:photosystem II stability/assembly factor-like uncharacterized protein